LAVSGSDDQVSSDQISSDQVSSDQVSSDQGSNGVMGVRLGARFVHQNRVGQNIVDPVGRGVS